MLSSGKAWFKILPYEEKARDKFPWPFKSSGHSLAKLLPCVLDFCFFGYCPAFFGLFFLLYAGIPTIFVRKRSCGQIVPLIHTIRGTGYVMRVESWWGWQSSGALCCCIKKRPISHFIPSNDDEKKLFIYLRQAISKNSGEMRFPVK